MTLPQMICNYQNNNDLDSLRDILEYLKSNPVYVITKIKISKKRLLTLPKDEIKFLLENPVSIDNKLYFSIFSKKVIPFNHVPSDGKLSFVKPTIVNSFTPTFISFSFL